jgi:hypothetical protein
VWVLFLESDGTVKSHQKISDTEGNFTGILNNLDYFGSSVASAGDIDGDGVNDIAVGAPGDNDGSVTHGAVWILFLETDGTVKTHQKISDLDSGPPTSGSSELFGISVTSIGDLDSNGVDV